MHATEKNKSANHVIFTNEHFHHTFRLFNTELLMETSECVIHYWHVHIHIQNGT